MPVNKKYLAAFECAGVYHVYNRTNNKERMFVNEENMFFFLKKYKEYLFPFTDTFCWCLLPNHFHLLIRVRNEKDILNHLETKERLLRTVTETKFLNGKILITTLLEKTFARLFQSYAQSFNKIEERKGNLFYKPFKRVLIESDGQFTQTVMYIHRNPEKHKLVDDFTRYNWSSWKSLLSEKPTGLLRNELFDHFCNKEKFIETHLNYCE